MHGKCIIFLVVSIETLMGQYIFNLTVISQIELSGNEIASHWTVKASECDISKHHSFSYNHYLKILSLVPMPVLSIS